MRNKSPKENNGTPSKPKPRKLTEYLRGKIYARISMTGDISTCWTGIDPICTEEEFKRWRTKDVNLRRDIEDAKLQKKISQRAKFKKLTEDRLEDILKNGHTKTQTIERTVRSYRVNPHTHETELIGFEVITGTTKTHDPFPEKLLVGLAKALNGESMPVQDAIVTLAGEGVLGEEQLKAIAAATNDYQQKLLGSINGKTGDDQINSEQTITVDVSE